MEAQSRAAERFRQEGKRQQIPAGEELYNTGKQPNGCDVFYLESGLCSLTGLARDGQESIFIYMPSPRVVGFMPNLPNAVIGEEPHVIITAKTACTVWRMSEARFRALLEEDFAFQREILLVLADNYASLLRHYQANRSQCATVRMCNFLLDYAVPEDGSLRIPASFNLAEVSRYLGVHTVTVSRIVTQLKQRGYIEKQGHRVILKDTAGLQRLIREQTNFDF